MLRLTRVAEIPGRSAGRWYTGWSTDAMRVYVVRAEGLRVDAAALARVGMLISRTAQLTIQLSGSLVSRRSLRELLIRERSIAVEPTVCWNERWIGPSFRALVIDWSRELGPTLDDVSTSTLNSNDHLRLSQIADALELGDERSASRAIVELDAMLRAIGLRIDGIRKLVSSREDPRDVETARWVSRLRSSLHEQPMWVDAVDDARRSERQLRRDVRELLRRLRIEADGLRSLLVHERIMSAAQLLSAKGVSVEEVALCVGFGSSRALGLALERAGLPTATTLSRSVRDE